MMARVDAGSLRFRLTNTIVARSARVAPHMTDTRTFTITGDGQRGFTIIELLVVLAIGLIMAAMAVPLVRTTMDDYHVRDAMVNAANFTQKVRTYAIQQDVTQRLHYLTVNGQPVLFAENAANTPAKPASTDPQLWLSTQFSIVGAPAGPGAPPQLSGTTMWGSTITPNINTDAYFNSRGLPCTPAPITNVCNVTGGFVYYFQYQSGGTTRWVASSISPAGRIESWFWNGSSASWGN
jgi:prepilin-type N-terminal cleavage/methylation domain-containing protein